MGRPSLSSRPRTSVPRPSRTSAKCGSVSAVRRPKQRRPPVPASGVDVLRPEETDDKAAPIVVDDRSNQLSIGGSLKPRSSIHTFLGFSPRAVEKCLALLTEFKVVAELGRDLSVQIPRLFALCTL